MVIFQNTLLFYSIFQVTSWKDIKLHEGEQALKFRKLHA